MVVRIARTGAPNAYRLTDPKAWTHPSNPGSGNEGAPETEGWGAPENKGCPPPETEGHEGTPLKDIQRRRSTQTLPTEQEWVAYCRETWPDWFTSADAWAYYQSVGWRVKAGPIKDWKAAARTAHGNAKAWGKLGAAQSEHDEYWRRLGR